MTEEDTFDELRYRVEHIGPSMKIWYDPATGYTAKILWAIGSITHYKNGSPVSIEDPISGKITIL